MLCSVMMEVKISSGVSGGLSDPRLPFNPAGKCLIAVRSAYSRPIVLRHVDLIRREIPLVCHC